MNYANSENGIHLVDCSSEIIGCEAHHVLDQKINTIWLSDEGLPQWLCLSLENVHNLRNIVLRTVGWHCWHPYSTNPKVVVLHVSADGSKFKQWDTFHATGPQKGSQLFCCAPISCALYPFLAFEITEVFGGNQTYMNRLYLYTEEISSSPAVSDISQRTTDPLSIISSNPQDSIETNSVLQKLEAALGLNDSRDEPPPPFPKSNVVVPPDSIRHSLQLSTPFAKNSVRSSQSSLDDDVSDIDSDSLPLTLTLSGERHGDKIIATQKISLPNESLQTNSQIIRIFQSHEKKIHPDILDESKANSASGIPTADVEREMKENPQIISESLLSVKQTVDRHDVSSLTHSHHSDLNSNHTLDVTNRLSELEGKMDALLKAFQSFQSPENSKRGSILESTMLPTQPKEAFSGSVSHPKSNKNGLNTHEEPGGVQQNSETADSLSVTSFLSKDVPISRTERSRKADLPTDLHESTSLNRSSAAIEAMQVMRNLETLIKSMAPTPSKRRDEYESENSEERPRVPLRDNSPPRRGENQDYGLHPQPSRSSPIQPCLNRSHSPSKGPGGVYRKEKTQPHPSSSLTSSLSSSCSCAYSSFPSRMNHMHLDHPTPLLPPSLNLPTPNTHQPHLRIHEPPSMPENERKYETPDPENFQSHYTVDVGGDQIADIVERLHKKIMERTLKEAELVLIQKTKKAYRTDNSERRKDDYPSSTRRFHRK